MEDARQSRLQRRTDLVAVGLVLLSALLYTIGYALSKRIVGTYGVSSLQVTFLRCVLVLAASIALVFWPHSRITWRRILRPARAWQQRVAAVAVLASIYLAVVGYAVMPVTDASALFLTAPVLLTALAGIALRERVSLNRWLGAGLGFAGMLCIVRPGAGAMSVGALATLGGALAYAIYQILIRRLRDVATSVDSVIQVSLVGTVALSFTLFTSWHAVGLRVVGLVVASTAVQTAGLFCIAAALRRGEASKLAPWQFFGLLWSILIDVVMFATMPSIGSLFGSGLIVLGGVLAHAGSRRISSQDVHGVVDGVNRCKMPPGGANPLTSHAQDAPGDAMTRPSGSLTS
jgi:drug/metabolite transporter (DMT)-like permease